MENSHNKFYFLEELINIIEQQDKLHSKKIKGNISYIREHFPEQLDELLGLIKEINWRINNTSYGISDIYFRNAIEDIINGRVNR